MFKKFCNLILLSLLIAFTSYPQGANSFRIELKNGWNIQSSKKINSGGKHVSSLNYQTKGWFPAEVPATVLGTLVKDKVYTKIFYSKNLDKIPTGQFEVPWWYRTEFIVPKENGLNTVKLKFNGINYRANIWINGKQVAQSGTTEGCFRRFEINISKYVKFGEKNALAVEVIPPVKGEPTMGFVDWNPRPPDRNMGLWRDVTLKLSGDVSINFPFVKSIIDTVTLKKAELTVSAEVQNNTGKKVEGVLSGKIGTINFSKNVVLNPEETKLVTFTPEDFQQLKINNPRLWWTHDFGKPELYSLKLSFNINKKVSDERRIKFGIRQVSDYFTSQGLRGYKLNGKKILIRGGGWTDHMLLNNSKQNLKYQIEYAKHMNLNTIRMEGFWGEDQDIYNLCDENGILIMVGWSAQWEWKGVFGKPADEFGGIKSPEDMHIVSESFRDQVKWLRNHPSIFLWLYGSDKLPRPALEKKYLEILKMYDPSRPSVASAHEHTSELTGKTAVKMRGPYDYEPPNYWYIDKDYGGAFGFNTETGPGPQVPPVESLKKMIPEDSLWPISGEWFYHCSRGMFKHLNRYNEAISARLGKPSSLKDYERKAQYTNYEAMRAMFEAFGANKFTSTGVIQWMYNAAWPKLWWQLYDYYLMPNGAFYGAKKADEPVHIQYNYGNNSVDIVNSTLKRYKNLSGKVTVLNFNLDKKFEKETKFNIDANESKQIMNIPVIDNLSKTYFVDMKLYNGKNELSSNFYCLSTQQDELDTAKTTWYVTPEKQYADLIELNNLPEINLIVKSTFQTNGNKKLVTAEVKNNTNKLAFLIRLTVTAGKQDIPVLPVFLEDNYFTLLPGEKRIINGYVYRKDLNDKNPKLRVSGWNVKTVYH